MVNIPLQVMMEKTNGTTHGSIASDLNAGFPHTRSELRADANNKPARIFRGTLVATKNSDNQIA
ncbi:unnamed protein product [marine sediment metagenome]|uniref:Uncharacterized protein n=1 Tax=marine sediment metagenome TaxID=412755 RepID=X1VX65_9ZZZZ